MATTSDELLVIGHRNPDIEEELFLVVGAMDQGSFSKSDFLRQIDYPMSEPGLYTLDGVVSHKKQLLPYLCHRLRSGPVAS